MDFDFKKPIIIFLSALFLFTYIRSHYSGLDVLEYSRKNPNPTISPIVDYYVGMNYYSGGKWEPAVQAFTQLLTDYPTHYYNRWALIRLGSSQEELRNWAGAREAYEKYLELYPEAKERNLVENKYNQVRFKD